VAIADKQQSAMRNRKIGFIFQFPSLLPTLNVLENVALPTVFNSNHRSPPAVDRATELLHTVGLSDKLTAFLASCRPDSSSVSSLRAL
jgi:ABC-type lipoprotein export system ATPase subunit